MMRTFLLGLVVFLIGAERGQGGIVTSFIDYRDEAGEIFQGFYAYDDSFSSPRPAVLIAHNKDGLGENDQVRARQYAEAGYVGSLSLSLSLSLLFALFLLLPFLPFSLLLHLGSQLTCTERESGLKTPLTPSGT